MGSSGISSWSSSPDAHLADEGGLFEEVVAGGGEEAALGDGAAPVALRGRRAAWRRRRRGWWRSGRRGRCRRCRCRAQARRWRRGYLISPALRRCSASRRSDRGRGSRGGRRRFLRPRRSASSKEIFSTRRRVLTKTSVERCECGCSAASLSKISLPHLDVEVREPKALRTVPRWPRSRWRRFWPT